MYTTHHSLYASKIQSTRRSHLSNIHILWLPALYMPLQVHTSPDKSAGIDILAKNSWQAYSSPQKRFHFHGLKRNGIFGTDRSIPFHSTPFHYTCTTFTYVHACKTQLGQRRALFFHSHGMSPGAVAIRLGHKFEKSSHESTSSHALSV